MVHAEQQGQPHLLHGSDVTVRFDGLPVLGEEPVEPGVAGGDMLVGDRGAAGAQVAEVGRSARVLPYGDPASRYAPCPAPGLFTAPTG